MKDGPPDANAHCYSYLQSDSQTSHKLSNQHGNKNVDKIVFLQQKQISKDYVDSVVFFFGAVTLMGGQTRWSLSLHHWLLIDDQTEKSLFGSLSKIFLFLSSSLTQNTTIAPPEINPTNDLSKCGECCALSKKNVPNYINRNTLILRNINNNNQKLMITIGQQLLNCNKSI